jgi:hypothetical protein
MGWTLPLSIEAIPPNSRVCWNCWHCMKWTAHPGSWVGRCMEERNADFGAYIWLERDTCGYFEAAREEAF